LPPLELPIERDNQSEKNEIDGRIEQHEVVLLQSASRCAPSILVGTAPRIYAVSIVSEVAEGRLYSIGGGLTSF
jgi:hypothetical protein